VLHATCCLVQSFCKQAGLGQRRGRTCKFSYLDLSMASDQCLCSLCWQEPWFAFTSLGYFPFPPCFARLATLSRCGIAVRFAHQR
jgi:hypothetical protein